MIRASLATDGTLLWFCPGCDNHHGVPVRAPEAHRNWQWNGSLESPTLTPSVLVTAHATMPPFKPQLTCHVFMTDGRLLFLGDCGHALAGQDVEMASMEQTDRDERNRRAESSPD